MSDTRRTIVEPRSNPDDSTLGVYGGFSVTQGGTGPVSMGWYLHGAGVTPDMNASHVLCIVVTPPTHGTLLKDGLPTSQFTIQDTYDGRVTYQHNGIGYAPDSYQVFAVITEVPGVEKPYTPKFYEHYDTSHGTQGSVTAGLVLAGATQMPRADWWSANSGTQPAPDDATVYPIHFSFQTTRPNTAVFVWTYSNNATWGAYDAPGYLPPIATSSVSYPGLTFTKLGEANVQNLIWDSVHGWFNYTTIHAELWWAPAPLVMPSATLTVTYPFYYDDFHPGSRLPHPYDVWALAESYYGLADFTNPTLGATGAIQLPFATTALPGQMNLTTTVSDQLVSPILFYVSSGSAYPSTGYVGDPPKGYALITGGGEGGQTGESSFRSYQRVGYCYATVNINIYHPIAHYLTDAELYFNPTGAFVDFADVNARRKFVSAAGCAQWLGLEGELPMGRPSVYLSAEPGDAAIFAQNKGTAEDFAITGELDLAGSAPCCTSYVTTETGGVGAQPEWRLFVSDDGGRTWSLLVKPRDIGNTGEYSTRLRWLKLGQFRTRLFRLESTDPVRRHIIGFYADLAQGMG